MKHSKVVLVMAFMLLLAACGRKLPDETPTSLPPTQVTEESAAVSTSEVTEVAGESTQEPVQADITDPYALRVADASAADGEQLFNQMTATGFACATCHNANSTQRLVGPGFLGLPQVAQTRVDGQTAPEYIYNSILHPSDFVVPDYPDLVMPPTYADVFTEDQVYNLVAYLMTLEDPNAVTSQQPAPQPTAETPAQEVTQSGEAQVVVVTTTPIYIVVTATPSGEEVVQETGSQPESTEVIQAEPTVAGTPDSVVTLASLGIPAYGESAFNQPDASGNACADCHYVDSTEELNGGPGLLGIPERAAQNAERLSAERFILNAILNTSYHTASNYETALTNSQKYDLVAYLMTLSAEGMDLSAPAENATAAADAGENPVIAAIAAADAAHGEEVFNTPNSTGFACINCHYPTSADRLVGPGLLGVATTASERVPGTPAELYLYESIINPSQFVVTDFPDLVMPRNYTEILTEQDIFDLVAYLLTLSN